MLYEHSMMFRLDTPPVEIDRALADARQITHQALHNVEIEKRRERIRECGTRLVRVVSFEVEGDDNMMEAMRAKLWEGHDQIISTLTVPHRQHERQTRYAPRRWQEAVDEWHSVGADRPAFIADVAPPRRAEPDPADRFSKDALMRRFLNGERKERKFSRPLPR
jgi:hypothetical protein